MIGSIWNLLRGSFVSTSPRKKSRRRRDGRSALLGGERLERRELLAANEIYFHNDLSAIVVEGTTGADSVTVNFDAPNVVRVTMVNATGTKEFTRAVAGVAQVRFIGSDGDDNFTNNSAIPSLALGEGGNDRLSAGSGGAYFLGGAGNDQLFGGSGADQVYGEDGDDLLDAGTGNDTLIGGAGSDLLAGGDGIDQLYGDDGNDDLYGGNGDDALDGGAGDDELWGHTGADTLTSGDGSDQLHGEAGNDTLYGGIGDDLLQGGSEDDLLFGGAGGDTLSGDDGNDSLYGEADSDVLRGGTGNDLLEGSSGQDQLFGGIGDDTIIGDDGNDQLFGEDGNDKLYAGLGTDLIQGGIGDDLMFGGAGGDMLYGDDGNDSVYGEADGDVLWGGAGIDLIDGGAANDQLFGGTGDDTLKGSDGDDQVFGEDGVDALYGDAGIDLVQGGFGNDLLFGGAAGDVLLGEDGNDNLYGEADGDVLRGGAGNDLIEAASGADQLFGGIGDDTLNGSDGDDQLFGEDGIDWLTGGAGSDFIHGDAGADTIFGGVGNDLLSGDSEADSIYGEGDHDTIFGGSGNDLLEGGSGHDAHYGGSGNDTIVGDDGNDVLFGDAGVDSLTGGAGNDILQGSADNDTLFGNAGNDALYGGAGDDNVYGHEGDDTIWGGTGNDMLGGNVGNDTLHGEDGNDTLIGDDGNDFLYGDKGDDVLRSLQGADVLLGGAGADQLFAGTENDLLIGGEGIDQVYGDDGDDILIGGTTEYDKQPIGLAAIAAAWSATTPYATRVAQIQDELFAAHLASHESVYDDYVADSLFGGNEQDWFLQTGFMPVYRPADVMPDEHGEHHEDHHAQIIVDELPQVEGFAFIDSLDKFIDRQAVETLSSLVPHANTPSLQREHLSLFQLVRYSDVTHYAVSSGDWSNPATWHNGVVPVNGAHVLISLGVNVQVDGLIAARLATIRVDGTLSFNTTRNTELRADTVIVSDSGHFEMGTEANPIARNVTAKLLITDNGPIDRSWDPYGISRGLVSHGAVTIHGADVSSFRGLASPLAGYQILTLETAPTGWKAGDEVIITSAVEGAAQNEVRQISSIVGNMLMLSSPLSYNHVPPAGNLKVHIANVTRNAVIESESTATDRRGHVMFMHSRDVAIAYAGFYKLGRTNKSQPVNDPVVNSDWTLKAGTGTNPRARYAVHFHRNGVIEDGNPATIVGSAVVDSPGWGYVNHTSYVNMVDNVAYNVRGAAFTTEVGNEIGGFYGNIAIGSTGTSEVINARELIQDFGFSGDGFWFQGAGVSVVNNVSAGNQGNAYVYYTRGLIEGGVQQQFLTANLVDQSIAGGATSVPVFAVPIRQFSGNVGYASHFGLMLRYHQETSTHSVHSLVDNSTFWNNTTGISIPYSRNVILRDDKVITNVLPTPAEGINGNSVTSNVRYENLTVTGYSTGIDVPRRGYNVVSGGTFNNSFDIVVFSNLDARTVLITNQLTTPKIASWADLKPVSQAYAYAYFSLDDVILNFGQFTNHRLYNTTQLTTATPFPTPRADLPEYYVGLTNQELWDYYGVAVGGRMVPFGAFTAPNIIGLIYPA